MSGVLNIKILILILFAGVLLTGSNAMPFVKAQPIHTSLGIDVPIPPKWKECTIKAILWDEKDNPLQNMDIDFYICSTEKIGTAKTNSHGVASLTYTFPEAGTYPIIANFSGTTSYAQSGSEYVDIIITDYTPYLVGGISVAPIIGVVGYIVFRRRKKAITMPMTTKEA